MQRLSHLPPPPHFGIEVVRVREPNEPGFLRRVSRSVRTVSPSGSHSEPLVYDEVERDAIDAVVIVPHFVMPDDGVSTRFVVLRSAARPPVVLRSARHSPMEEPENRGLWELPAGLVESDERSPDGLRRAAVRELLEEAGFEVAPEELSVLGPSSFPAPGIIAERHFFFHVEVDPVTQVEPVLDGSPLEEAGELVAIPLEEALRAARAGELADAKTELALRRLAEELSA